MNPAPPPPPSSCSLLWVQHAIAVPRSILTLGGFSSPPEPGTPGRLWPHTLHTEGLASPKHLLARLPWDCTWWGSGRRPPNLHASSYCFLAPLISVQCVIFYDRSYIRHNQIYGSCILWNYTDVAALLLSRTVKGNNILADFDSRQFNKGPCIFYKYNKDKALCPHCGPPGPSPAPGGCPRPLPVCLSIRPFPLSHRGPGRFIPFLIHYLSLAPGTLQRGLFKI